MVLADAENSFASCSYCWLTVFLFILGLVNHPIDPSSQETALQRRRGVEAAAASHIGSTIAPPTPPLLDLSLSGRPESNATNA
jgi:hypothetical protein